MQTKPAARCQHITTSGVQCGSPALRNLRFCYYHQQGHSQAMEYYSEAPFTAIETDLPLFEDAHSIQLALRQVAHMLLQQKIDGKTAGLLLYSLQIASANLKQMKAEKPQPAQVVVDLDTVAETPLEAPAANEQAERSPQDSQRSTQSQCTSKKKGEPWQEVRLDAEYFLTLGEHLDDPAGTVEQVLKAKRAAEAGKAETEPNDGLPPGTIQACARRSRNERRYIN